MNVALVESGIERMQVLGVPISLVDLPRAVDAVTTLARQECPHMVFVRDVASLMLAVDEPELLALHHKASLVVPDGTPLVWVGKIHGYGRRIGRVAGADLVDGVCRASLATGQSHFFYGGKPDVAEKMARRLCERHPGLRVTGTFSPPMREMSPASTFDAEQLAEIETIRRAKADFVWVGISSPKQEYWMTRAAPILGCGVFLGVGAAFDFHAGVVERAPDWMRNNGLEWLHRLANEPKRLWRRYLVLAPRFIFSILIQALSRSHSP